MQVLLCTYLGIYISSTLYALMVDAQAALSGLGCQSPHTGRMSDLPIRMQDLQGLQPHGSYLPYQCNLSPPPPPPESLTFLWTDLPRQSLLMLAVAERSIISSILNLGEWGSRMFLLKTTAILFSWPRAAAQTVWGYQV